MSEGSFYRHTDVELALIGYDDSQKLLISGGLLWSAQDSCTHDKDLCGELGRLRTPPSDGERSWPVAVETLKALEQRLLAYAFGLGEQTEDGMLWSVPRRHAGLVMEGLEAGGADESLVERTSPTVMLALALKHAWAIIHMRDKWVMRVRR